MRNLFIVIGLLIFIIIVAMASFVSSEEIKLHLISETGQRIAIEYRIYTNLLNIEISLRPSYLDMLTVADLVATERANMRGTKVSDDDYRFAFAAECEPIPWGPPKPPPEAEKMKRLRPKIFSQAYIFENKRNEIKKMLSRKFLGLTREDMIKNHIHPVMIFSEWLR